MSKFVTTYNNDTVIRVDGYPMTENDPIDPFVSLYVSRDSVGGKDHRFAEMSLSQAIDLARYLDAAIRDASA